MSDILLGFMVGAWVFTVLGNIYVQWRYTFKPWQVMRKDIKGMLDLNTATNARIDQLEQALRPNKISAMSDEQLASIENRLRQARRKVTA
jgi:hypothetical protein